MVYLIRLKVVTGPINSLYWGHREKEAEEHFPINFCDFLQPVVSPPAGT